MRELFLVIASVSILLWEAAFAAPRITNAELRQAVDELSASTLVGGEGWKAYDRPDGFSGYVSNTWIN